MTTQTIHLHGFLGQKYAKSVKLYGDNLFQIMSGLVSRFGPQFKEDVRSNDWHIVEGKVQPGNDLDEKELGKKLTKKSLHLIPAVRGASAALRVIIGVIIFAVGAYFGQPWLMAIGASLVIGGVTEMLTKSKTASSDKGDQRASSIYNGALNVTTQGGPVPLIYGRVARASSVVISTDFSSDE